MPTRNAQPLVFRARTLSDTVDSTNGPQGAMQLLQNLVPAPFSRDIMVPRNGAVALTTFGSFNTPIGVELQFIVGHRIYGMVQSSRFPGKSEPFVYDYVANTFITVNNVTNANTPTSTSNTGDWIPPTATQVGGIVLVTHPGYTGAGGIFFGWFDVSGFTSNTVTGNTHTSTTVDTLSANPIAAGWTVGMTVSSSAGDIPAGTVITALTSTSITLSNAATGSNVGVTLTVAGGTLAAPLWTAGNLNGNPLIAVPQAVLNFNGRAYFAVGSALPFSDPAAPLQRTNANQALNFLNGLTITALSTTPFSNLTGGIVQALLAWQGTGAIWQITGDAALNNLSLQILASGEGTLAPNAITFIPNIGTSFVSPDGLQFVTLQGIVTPAVGTYGDGIALPLISAPNPTRMASSWNDDTLRIAVTTGVAPAQVSGASVLTSVEYWFHTKLNVWSGPHTFPATLSSARQDRSGFIVSSLVGGPGFWSSDTVPLSTRSYVEFGVLLQCRYLTSLLPDNQQMTMNALAETMIGLASANGMSALVTIQRENGQTLDTVTIPVTGQTSTNWNQFNWNQANWAAQASQYTQYQVFWHQPTVFKQCFIGVIFPAGIGNMVGNIYMRVQRLGYVSLGVSDAA